MSIQPSQLLELAGRLIEAPCESERQEVDLRCSTSRAYYAALHAADDSLPSDLALTIAERRGKSSHQAVIDRVTLWSKGCRAGRTEAIFIARNLARLRDYRKKADYGTDHNFSFEEASSALRLARETVARATRAVEQAVAQIPA